MSLLPPLAKSLKISPRQIYPSFVVLVEVFHVFKTLETGSCETEVCLIPHILIEGSWLKAWVYRNLYGQPFSIFRVT